MSSKYLTVVTINDPFETLNIFVNHITNVCTYIIFTHGKSAYSTIFVICEDDVSQDAVAHAYNSRNFSAMAILGLHLMVSHLNAVINTECLKYRSCNVAKFRRIDPNIYFDEFLVYIANESPPVLPAGINIDMNIPGQISRPPAVFNIINIHVPGVS